MKRGRKKIDRLLKFFNNGEKYDTNDELIIEKEKTEWGVEFTLHPYNWLAGKNVLCFDAQTRYRQTKVEKSLRDIDYVNAKKLSQIIGFPVYEIFNTSDDFEINSLNDFTVYVSNEENGFDEDFVILYTYNSRNMRENILVAKFNGYNSDLFELHLHGAEFYCRECENNKCACSGDFCEIETETEFCEFETTEKAIEYVRNRKVELDRLLNHPRLFNTNEWAFKRDFIGDSKVKTDDFLIDGEDVYCPNCLNVQKIRESFSLYT